MRRWKVAFLAGLGYASWDAADVIASLASLGYEGIEWTQAHFDPDLPFGALGRIVERTRDAGLEVSRIMAHEDLVSLDDAVRRSRIERTVRTIHAAGACGVATVGTMTGPAPWDPAAPKVGRDISEGAAWEQVFEAYEAFGSAAKEAGVTITSEGVFGMVAHDFYTHRFMMDRLDPAIHRVNLDPSHGILYGNEDPGWVVRQWGDRIGHVHLKDAVGEPIMGKFVFPLLGEGRVDWPGFFGALDAIGYEGFCSVEFEAFDYYRQILGGDPEAAARISMELVKALTRDMA
ncbi:MAG: sugar phosphate isomerase/epimerase [Chthonomonadales bacterium]|nr:sugar phosphate isomerase/epimerase [Chthonomonadales bacterium]